MCSGAEIPVDPIHVEPEILQTGLQRRHIVPVQGRGQLIDQGAGTETVRRFFQRPIRCGTDDAVDEQTTLLLEGAHSTVELVIEDDVGADPLVGGF